ncbi:putative ATPase (AAA superfamily protein) [Desulforapulum autotrophicum HRM2]|uniref:ATPase (AAA superfamily protein) n=1 Tax=Desulforapulum autotrophicum (strain ATCC 43914 / DSM 3382 / VKM B-1955 / HRM2) TaxID=177437 RepID=C0Q8S8_DESAH|nr:ATP-binding protein [Desulforapulum autotrophicum]ACN14418.1 putative ATPase (AAA superfamily protein) [Desulforapulum autotrophicum HRM2]
MAQQEPNIIIANNARALDAELKWFQKVLDARLKLQMDNGEKIPDISAILPPRHDSDTSMYASLTVHYGMNYAERLAFILALIPHIKPQLLDIFLTQNAETNRCYTQFGGKNALGDFKGFLPTGETLLYILAGDSLEKRFAFSYLFAADHFFSVHGVLTLEKATQGTPWLSGALVLSPEMVDLVTTGVVRKPVYGADFPAKQIRTQQEPDELFLPPHTMEQVLEIKSWVQHGGTLLEELGLGEKIKPGYRALFYGPPGTGKTFTASLLGRLTGCDVYRIDLSAVVSKYIGETEKNLEKIFSRAEHKNWILFFDEADALFGKRTSIKDAHDRFANQEVSYLLQRLEDFNGVVILSTNFKSNMDDAFTRRFQSIIHFPLPKQGDRLRIWKNAFSEKTLLEDQVSLPELAEKYELSGGAIMNVVRYVTLMALKNQRRTITGTDILDGVRKEFQKEGRTV